MSILKNKSAVVDAQSLQDTTQSKPDELAALEFEKREQRKQKVTYLPSTFEGMMECFGVNLQRKNHYDKLHEQIKAMNTSSNLKAADFDKQVREAAA